MVVCTVCFSILSTADCSKGPLLQAAGAGTRSGLGELLQLGSSRLLQLGLAVAVGPLSGLGQLLLLGSFQGPAAGAAVKTFILIILSKRLEQLLKPSY